MAPLLTLVEVLRVGQIADIARDGTLRRPTSIAVHGKRAADELGVRAVEDRPIRGPDPERDDLLAHGRALTKEGLERIDLGLSEAGCIGQRLQFRRDEALDVEGGHRGSAVDRAGFYQLAQPPSHRRSTDDDQGQADEQEAARQRHAVEAESQTPRPEATQPDARPHRQTSGFVSEHGLLRRLLLRAL